MYVNTGGQKKPNLVNIVCERLLTNKIQAMKGLDIATLKASQPEWSVSQN